MIEIRDITGKLLFTAPLTERCIYRHDLMKEEYVQLSFRQDACMTWPAGAWMEYEGKRFSLLDPYTPTRDSEDAYTYEPRFESVVMSWKKQPLFFFTTNEAGEIDSAMETDWSGTMKPGEFMDIVLRNLRHFTGEQYVALIDTALTEIRHLQFQSASIFEALCSIADTWETEWWVAGNEIHLSRCYRDLTTDTQTGEIASLTLEVGRNIQVPQVNTDKEGYYNRFYAFGSTRNLVPGDKPDEGTVAHLVHNRLRLPEEKYPYSYKDLTAEGESLRPGEIFVKTLVFDHIYPKSELTVGTVWSTFVEVTDSEGNRIVVGEEGGNPLYKVQEIFYVQLCTPSQEEGVADKPFTEAPEVISGKALSLLFESGSLSGWEFEAQYFERTQIRVGKDQTETVLTHVYRIHYDDSTGLNIPNTVMHPAEGDRLILLNVELPQAYVTAAQLRLEEALDEEMERRRRDWNTYEFDSNPVAFYQQATDLHVGQKVVYVDGDHRLETRVLSVEKNLDEPFRQHATIGEERIVGSTQALREEVAEISENVELLRAVSEMHSSIVKSYKATQEKIQDGLEAIGHMWELDKGNPIKDEADWIVRSRYNVVSEKAIVAQMIGRDLETGSGSGNGGGSSCLHELLDVDDAVEQAPAQSLLYKQTETGKWTTLTRSGLLNGYVTHTELESRGYLDSSSMLAMNQVSGLSAELARKADKTISVTAGTGLTGGGTLSQNLTLALATSGAAAGTYPKVTVDTYGRVTKGEVLTAADIPALSMAKITHLESTLEKKMEQADFDELFEKVNIGTSAHPVWAIRAKLGLYSDSFLSASGLNDASGSTKDYFLLEDWDRYDGSKSDFVLSAFLGYDLHTRVLSLEDKVVTVKESGDGNAYTSFRYDNHILTLVKGATFLTSSALTGYATESWVDSKGYLTASSAASTYVTLTTTQTLSGQKTFTSNINSSSLLPRTDATHSIGTAAPRYLNIYTSYNIYGGASIYSNGKTSTTDGVAGGVLGASGNLSLTSATNAQIAFYGNNQVSQNAYIRNNYSQSAVEIANRLYVGTGSLTTTSYRLYIDGANYFNGTVTVAGALSTTGNTTIGGTVTVGGLGTFSKNLQTSEYIQIGTIRIQYDKENNGLKVVGSGGEAAGLYATSYLSAAGIGGISSGGGGLIESVYSVNNFGESFSASDYTNTFNAHAINSLYNRIVSLEGKAITVAQSGTGNAYTSFTYTNNTLTLVKGTTFATTSDLGSYVKKAGDTMSGSLTVYNPVTVYYGGSTAGKLLVTGYTGASWGTGSGALGVAISDNDAQTPLIVGYRNGSAVNATGTNRIFSMELLNSGTSMRYYFGGVANFIMARTSTTSTFYIGPSKSASNDGIGGHVFYSSSGRHYLQSGTSGTNPGLDFYQYGTTERDAYLINTNGGLYTTRFAINTTPDSNYRLYVSGVAKVAGNFIAGEINKTSGTDGYTGMLINSSYGRVYLTGSVSYAPALYLFQNGSASQLGTITLESAADSTARMSFSASNGLYTGSRWYSTAVYAFTLNYNVDNAPPTFIYKDTTNFYILLGNTGSNTYNSLRPFYINLTSGKVNINTDFAATGATSISNLTAISTATFNSMIRPPFVSSTWLAVASTTNIIEPSSWVTGSATLHGLFRIRTYSGHSVAFGGYGNTVGFHGVSKSNIDAASNTVSFRTYWTPASGLLTHSGAFNVSGAVTFSSTLSVSAQIYGKSSVYSGGKTSTTDGAAGACLTNTGNLYLSHASNPAIFFHYANTTATTTYMTGDANGGIRLQPRVGIGAQSNTSYTLYVSGASYFAGAISGSSTLTIAGNSTLTGNLYERSNMYVGATKTSATDGTAGVSVYATGNIYMTSTSIPYIYFYYAGATSATSYIGDTGSGIRLHPRVGIGVAPSTSYALYVSGASYFNGAVTMSSNATISGSVHITSTVNSSSSVSDASLKIAGGVSIAKDLWAANVFSTGAVTAQTTSDRNAKYDFQAFDACQVLLALGQVMRFRYKETHKEAIGPVYQDVVRVLPQMDARQKGDKYGSLNYLHPDYINLIAASCQQTIQKVETIGERVDRLEKENKELKQQVEQLKHTYHAGK